MSKWVEFLRIFTFVKDLELSGKLSYYILEALRELAGEGAIDALPALQNIFVHRFWVAGYFMKDVELFVAARQVSGRPVAVHHFD